MYKALNRQKRLGFILLLLTSFSDLSAKTDELLKSISNELAYYDEIATATKQNEHYQPYIISVFQGKELEKLGVSNLKEALGLVPGVDMATDNLNNQTPIFRGSNTLAYGQSKLFIDGVAVNNLFFDSYFEYLSFPIEMIKRIEVVRGPGSTIGGVNAYAGSINVITYAEDFKGFESSDKLVFKHGSYNYNMGGFIKTYKTDDLKVFIDFFYQEDNKKLPVGFDGLYQGVFGVNNIPLSRSGDAPLWLRDYSLGLNLEYKDFSIKARTLNHTGGSAYGVNLALPQEGDRAKLPSHYLELGYDKKIADYAFDIKAGVKYGTIDSKSKLAPDGLVFENTIFEDGMYGEHYAVQRTLYQSSYIKYSGINQHKLTAGYRFSKEETIDMTSKLSNVVTGDAGLVDYTETMPFFDKNAKRNILAFSLQDEFLFSSAFSFIYGINYEQTSYKDGGFDPRVSMVYQLDSKNIFKTMYSRSHRIASWQEMFTMNNNTRVGSTDLESERVDAFEAAYIKKFSSDTHLSSNLFYLCNKNQIYNSFIDPRYRNVVDTDIYGLELEYKGYVSSFDQLYLNYSYVTGKSSTQDEGKSESLPNVAHHLAKGYYIYNLSNALSLSGIAKYVGSKDRVPTDTRGKAEAYSTVDTSLSYKDKKYDYTLTFSIKNIFNANVTFPSPPYTYIDDYAQERRTFLATFIKPFK
ncbi:MAG: TonB-dependent receptor plug domain-containing protein [Sulfurimonas sp.]|uniref:TonB-dependent receptor plug domain-containing protein n=1 Tax=Sulfurimonas sp. TaxID=2022749 RepID=UPI002619EB7C|nr:TonB-dependent receptor plug domain-containing protein [Sulfurimonas sp.]MDD5372283.1 TonB-dependent receptor plug domain-containing protein [Sulfurimonas sp.]